MVPKRALYEKIQLSSLKKVARAVEPCTAFLSGKKPLPVVETRNGKAYMRLWESIKGRNTSTGDGLSPTRSTLRPQATSTSTFL
jgi:hypothetical protein